MSARRDQDSQQERSPYNRLSDENPQRRPTESTSRRSSSQIRASPSHDQLSPQIERAFDNPQRALLERLVPLHRQEDLQGPPRQFAQQPAPVQPDPFQPARFQPAPAQPVRVQADLNQPVNVQVDIDHPVIHRRGAQAQVAGQGAFAPHVSGERIFVRQLDGAPFEPPRFFRRSRIPLAPPPNFIPIGRFRLEFTVNAERIVYFMLALTTNTASVVTGAVFWVAAGFFIWTFFTSQVPGIVFNELIQRYIAGYPPNGSIWGYMFPATESNNAHQVRLTVHIPGYPHPRMIYSTTIPILLGNPVFWLILMVCMWMSHRLLYSVHGFLRNAHERLEQQPET